MNIRLAIDPSVLPIVAPAGATITGTGTVVWPPGFILMPPSACPGCGRCKDCGHPFAAPVVPAFPYAPPYDPTGTGPFPFSPPLTVTAYFSADATVYS